MQPDSLIVKELSPGPHTGCGRRRHNNLVLESTDTRRAGSAQVHRSHLQVMTQNRQSAVPALSENSIESSWVEREVQAAFEREDKSKKLVLFPIRLDEAVMETTKAWAADIRRTRHIGEFGQWREHGSYKRALERLLRDLKAGEAVDSG